MEPLVRQVVLQKADLPEFFLNVAVDIGREVLAERRRSWLRAEALVPGVQVQQEGGHEEAQCEEAGQQGGH